jgi:hypothetical protein
MIGDEPLPLLMCESCEEFNRAGEHAVPALCDVCTAATLCAWEEFSDGLVRTCVELAEVLARVAIWIRVVDPDADGVRAWFARRRLS